MSENIKDSSKANNQNREKTNNEKELKEAIKEDLEINEKNSEEENNNLSNETQEYTVDSLKKELEENKDRLLRSLAEGENTRKQMEKIRIESNKYGVQPLAREILNVVDNFDRALNLKNEKNEKALEEGLTLIQKEILTILEKFNVKKINAIGEDFDANFHQAMFEKETDQFEVGKVCEIIQDGYTFHDRLLRPVLVGVAKELKNSNLDDGSENNENQNSEEQNV